mmetsp:Transcript_101115/g.326364  ORF Transcript_101115/g.326364 Transcript_101115/m.326364 type:complete len:269 (+) Transcript_101115:285-1091(+)
MPCSPWALVSKALQAPGLAAVAESEASAGRRHRLFVRLPTRRDAGGLGGVLHPRAHHVAAARGPRAALQQAPAGWPVMGRAVRQGRFRVDAVVGAGCTEVVGNCERGWRLRKQVPFAVWLQATSPGTVDLRREVLQTLHCLRNGHHWHARLSPSIWHPRCPSAPGHGGRFLRGQLHDLLLLQSAGCATALHSAGRGRLLLSLPVRKFLQPLHEPPRNLQEHGLRLEQFLLQLVDSLHLLVLPAEAHAHPQAPRHPAAQVRGRDGCECA